MQRSQDEDEDWSRWRDVVFRAKGALSPYGVNIPVPPQNRRKRGGPVYQEPLSLRDGNKSKSSHSLLSNEAEHETPAAVESPNCPSEEILTGAEDTGELLPQLTVEEALKKLQAIQVHRIPTSRYLCADSFFQCSPSYQMLPSQIRPRIQAEKVRQSRSRCIVPNAICPCTPIPNRNVYTYFCTPCGIQRVWAALRRRCQNGPKKAGPGNSRSTKFNKIVPLVNVLRSMCFQNINVLCEAGSSCVNDEIATRAVHV